MNILIPDIWLRSILKTRATPEQLKEYLSLCGPSVERIYGEGKETVYDIEITGNRPDAMSVVGVAREAATILPRFGIDAELTDDPYMGNVTLPKGKDTLKLTLTTDPVLNPRWMSVVFDNVSVRPSPEWLTQYLALSGIRSINNVVDITNFLMRAYGQPAHVFDYDQINGHKMTLRASRKGEKLVTLDGKPHVLPGGDIVIEDGSGTLIDLCGIMGGQNSSVSDKTKRVMLFLQTYNPVNIRKTSMALSHRTEAAGLFEKGLDTELVKPVFVRGVTLMEDLTGGSVASKISDIYPRPPKARSVSVQLGKLRSYIGKIEDKEIKTTLTSLGFDTSVSKTAVTVTVPSYRNDVTIDVDIIEEVARIYGYHNIPSVLPSGVPPTALPDRSLELEEDIKMRLRDWGFTEFITYSMISEALMDTFDLDKEHAYRVANPLSQEWVYLRPHAIASFLPAFVQNLDLQKDIKAFELSTSYVFRNNTLPHEIPVLNVLWSGDAFLQAKGLAESIFSIFGIDFQSARTTEEHSHTRYSQKSIRLGEYASLGVLRPAFLKTLGVETPITRLYINIEKMIQDAKPRKSYTPVPRYPPVVEDLSFVVPEKFEIGPLISALNNGHPLVSGVTLLDIHKDTRTLHIVYQDTKRNLTSEAVVPVRNKLIEIAMKKFGLRLKTAD